MEKALEIGKYLTEKQADFDDVYEHSNGTIENTHTATLNTLCPS